MSFVVERGQRPHLRYMRNGECGAHTGEIGHQFGGTDSVANPHSRQTVGFRECAQHNHFMAAFYMIESIRAIDAAADRKVFCEIVVRLIEDNDHMLRNAFQKAIEHFCRDECPGWIVGIRNVEDASMLIDRRSYSVQIKAIISHRNLDELPSRCLRGNRIHDKRTLAGYRIEPWRQ